MFYPLRRTAQHRRGVTGSLMVMIMHGHGVWESDLRNGLVFSSFYARIFRFIGELQHTYFGALSVVSTIYSVHPHNIYISSSHPPP